MSLKTAGRQVQSVQSFNFPFSSIFLFLCLGDNYRDVFFFYKREKDEWWRKVEDEERKFLVERAGESGRWSMTKRPGWLRSLHFTDGKSTENSFSVSSICIRNTWTTLNNFFFLFTAICDVLKNRNASPCRPVLAHPHQRWRKHCIKRNKHQTRKQTQSTIKIPTVVKQSQALSYCISTSACCVMKTGLIEVERQQTVLVLCKWSPYNLACRYSFHMVILL